MGCSIHFRKHASAEENQAWRQYYLRSVVLGFFGPIALLLGTVNMAAQTTDICHESADQPFEACLGSIAKYTGWMVVPGRDVTPGDLQQAVDEVSGKLQSQWHGSLKSRTYLKWLYAFVPLGFLVYFGTVMLVSRFAHVQFAVAGPKWRIEKLAILGGALAIAFFLIGERWFTYDKMNDEYKMIPRAIARFVHLNPPVELANATGNPCEAGYKDDELLLSLCNQEWATGAHKALGRLIDSVFARPSLLGGPLEVGHACQRVTLVPGWWDSEGVEVDPGERAMKMACPVYAAGDSVVEAGRLTGLAELRKWILAAGGSATVLKLEDTFGVQTAGGGRSVYREKVQELVGPEKYQEYREQFLRTSWLWIGPAVIGLLFLASIIYYLRRQELVFGSKSAGVRRWRGLWIGLLVSGVGCLVAASALIFN